MIELLGEVVNKPTNTDTLVDAMQSASSQVAGSVVDAASSVSGAIEAQTAQIGIDIQGVADLIGVSTDSLLKHLDSIWKSLKPNIQDSIMKYQRYADDKLDSVLYGKGKGFSLIDSLIDSTVKYFRNTVAALETLSVDVGLDSGLFTTDTTINPTVRNIDSLLVSIRDTSLYTIWSEIQYLGDTVNTLKPFMEAMNDSLGNLMGVDAWKCLGDSMDCVVNLTVLAIGWVIPWVPCMVLSMAFRGSVDGLGDSMSGWWNGNGKGGLDTSGNGVGGAGLDSVLNGTSLYGDSAGVAHIVRAGINDTSLHYGAGGVFDTSGILGSGSDVDTTGDVPFLWIRKAMKHRRRTMILRKSSTRRISIH